MRKGDSAQTDDEIRWTHSSGALSEFSDSALESSSVLRVFSAGRERVEQVGVAAESGSVSLVAKTFSRAPFFQRLFAFGRPSKAQRAFRAAEILREHGVGTPRAIALRERFCRGALVESKLFCEFVPGLTDFRRELQRLFSDGNDASAIAELLDCVARACRAFHDAGIVHHDLGNQNIGLKKNASGAWEICFLDLDRVRIFPAGTLSDAQRGTDLARLNLPSELRWFFCTMYWYCTNSPEPQAFRRALKRGMFAWKFHCKTRISRHPVQEISRKFFRSKNTAESPEDGRGIWLWDERSVQAVPAPDPRDRRKLRPFFNVLKMAQALVFRGNTLWKNYREIEKLSFSEPEDFAGTIGMTLEADSPENWATQMRWLGELEGAGEKLPILLRVYRHKGRAQWAFAVEKAQELRARGNAVAFALVQDREAVRAPQRWAEMLDFVVEKTHAFADFYEIGHATNRGKWGIWDFRDYTEKLLAPALETKKKFPQIKLVGPACIDFDMHSLPAILEGVPAGTFSALSQHLYVDRRGAPENFQGKFDLVKKCAFHRAVAKTYGFSHEKIIVSETNWPLIGTGTFSPCAAFFCEKGGPHASPPSVSEEDYAKYMCRYLLLAVASGHVSRVYWWRLVHRGFGLVDDSDSRNPRPRQAFFALKNLLEKLSDARFLRRDKSVPAGTWKLELSRKNDAGFSAEWTLDSSTKFKKTERKK